MTTHRVPYPNRAEILEQNLRAEHQLIHRLETQISELRANHQARLERLMSDNRIYARMLVNLTLNIQACISNHRWTEEIINWILDNAEGDSAELLNNLENLRLEVDTGRGDVGCLSMVNVKDEDQRWVFGRCRKTDTLDVLQSGRLVTD